MGGQDGEFPGLSTRSREGSGLMVAYLPFPQDFLKFDNKYL
jgi:hypothetical protein